MKFDFSKSTEADFRNKLQSDLDILMSNILYITHECDQIKKLLMTMAADSATQKQVDEYFDETSHQTEQSEQ